MQLDLITNFQLFLPGEVTLGQEHRADSIIEPIDAIQIYFHSKFSFSVFVSPAKQNCENGMQVLCFIFDAFGLAARD